MKNMKITKKEVRHRFSLIKNKKSAFISVNLCLKNKSL